LTVAEALRGAGIDAREARLLLADATGWPESIVVAFPERALTEEAVRTFTRHVARCERGEPIAYIVGHKEFYGIDLDVGPSVLIPRPETELLVDLVLARKPASVVDLGTGSGAIAVAVKRHLPAARVVATDVSAEALAMARRNAARHGLGIEFRHGAWFAPLDGERFEAIVCNPPYVVAGDPHLAALLHEPREAIVAGADGLDAFRVIARDVSRHLVPGGWVLFEHGAGQHAAVLSLLESAGLDTVQSWPDLAGIPRVVGGRR